MAKFRYQHIMSAVEDKAPDADFILDGEIAVNTFAGKEKLFIKNSEGDVVSIGGGGGGDLSNYYTKSETNDLLDEKLDASAYTPTDLSNYYKKNETSGASEIADALDEKLDVTAYTPTDLSNYYTKDETSGKTELETEFAKKLEEADIADFFDNAEYVSSAKTINFYHGDDVKVQIDATDFIKDGMVDDVKIENGNLVITFNTDAGKETITIPLTDIFDPDNYYTKQAIDGITGAIQLSIDRHIEDTDVHIQENERDLWNTVSGKVGTEEYEEDQAVIASALNDLDNRKVEQSDLDELEVIISAALNDLDNRKIEQSDLDELEVIISAALNDLDNRKIEQSDLNELEAIISAALNDLDNRKLNKSENITAVTINEDSYLRLEKEDDEKSIGVDLSGLVDTDSFFASTETYPEEMAIIFKNLNGESVDTVYLTGMCPSYNDLLTGVTAGNIAQGDNHFLNFYTSGSEQPLFGINLDEYNWFDYECRSVSGYVDPYNYEEYEKYRLNLYSSSEPNENNIIYNADVSEWFSHFYNYYVPYTAYSEDNSTYHTVTFYNNNGSSLFSVDINDYNDNDNDYVTDFYYSNDSSKQLTIECTNGTFSTNLYNLAELEYVTVSGYNNVIDTYYESGKTGIGRYIGYNLYYNSDHNELYRINLGYMATNYDIITGVTANLPEPHGNKYITLTTSGGTELSADCKQWFAYYGTSLSAYTEGSSKSIMMFDENNNWLSSVDLSSWFYEKANYSAFTAHTSDTTVHITSDERRDWNTAYNSLSGFVTDGRYESHYRPEGYSEDIPAILLTNHYGPYENVLAYIDATPFIVDGMVDNVQVLSAGTSGATTNVLRITFNTDAGKQPIDVPLYEIFDPKNYYTTTETDNLLLGKASTGDTITGVSYDSTSGYLYLNKNNQYNSLSTNIGQYFANYSDFTGHTANTDIHVTYTDKSSWNSAYNTVTANSSDWSSAYSTVTANSNNWDAAYTAVTANSSDWNATVTGLTAHTADTSVHFTPSDLQASGFVSTQYTAYTAVTDTIADDNMSPITSNAVYDWTDGVKIKKISQSDYDDLVNAGTVDPNTLYIII